MSPSNPSARPSIEVGGRRYGGGELFVIAGPCVLESRELALSVAERLVAIAAERGVPLIFKSSFDKANRSSIRSVRGPGLAGLEWLGEVRERFHVPVLTDVHLPDHCQSVAEIVGRLQIPAFLCRPSDL